MAQALFDWILKMEERLEISVVYSIDLEAMSKTGSLATQEIVLGREERARAFGTTDAVVCRMIGVLHRAGVFDEEPEEGHHDEDLMNLVSECPERGMVVDVESPEADLREWANRLERRLGIDGLSENEKRGALGQTDAIAKIDKILKSMEEE